MVNQVLKQLDTPIPKYSSSRQGNPIILLGEYRFKKRSRHTNQKQEVHWVCNKIDKGCKAKLTTWNDAIIRIYNVHKHDGVYYTTTKKGNRSLVVNGYSYALKQETSVATHWRCSRYYNRCRAIAHTLDGRILKCMGFHNHPPPERSPPPILV
ncbi:unnamed protein product [Leptosia nina]|uniref:FLYWCH-type domain-containing protein n=1 Tax=Leptosia nina TaxID=320188 RepID=A0AAV1J5Y7_9NEOP